MAFLATDTVEKGVLRRVNFELSISISTCQIPFLTSNILKLLVRLSSGVRCYQFLAWDNDCDLMLGLDLSHQGTLQCCH